MRSSARRSASTAELRLARLQRGLGGGDLGGARLERLLGGRRALLELAALALELLRDLVQRPLARLDPRPLLGGGGLELAGVTITLGNRLVALAHRALAGREAGFGLLLAGLERRTLALQLALALADLGQLLRELGGGLGTLALGMLQLVDTPLGMSGELLHARVLGDDLRVALDERRLLALELRDALLQRLLALLEILRPRRQLLVALGDRACGLLELVARDALALDRRVRLGTRGFELGEQARGRERRAPARPAAPRRPPRRPARGVPPARRGRRLRLRLRFRREGLRSPMPLDRGAEPCPKPFSVSGGVTSEPS